ncbi:hypothetical protein [Bacillus mycoides]|uniref:hypothetical protein n=1 Tax=Bacillus mycoides TaxID=1405 RepID=UPI002E2394D5|nr:hypothetical protein [Bacillus mycoides]
MKILLLFGQGEKEAREASKVLSSLIVEHGFTRRKDLEKTIGEVIVTKEEDVNAQ